MKVALSTEQTEFIQSQITAGEYQSPEEVIATALELLKSLNSEEISERLALLQERIRIGTEQIQRGQVQDGEEVFDRLHATYS